MSRDKGSEGTGRLREAFLPGVRKWGGGREAVAQKPTLGLTHSTEVVTVPYMQSLAGTQHF